MAGYRYDLVVVGGGSGGIGAALAAARRGAKVLLVEARNWLGGTSTSGGVHCWETGAGGTGIPFDIYRRLRREPGAAGVSSCGRHFAWQKSGFHWPHELDKVEFPGGENVIDPDVGYLRTLRRHPGPDREKCEAFVREFWHGIPFEPEAFHRVVLDMLAETGNAEVRLDTRFEGASLTQNRLASVFLEGGEGVSADAFVDATGDGLLCRAAGCEQLVGADPQSRFHEPGAPAAANRRLNAATLIFRVTPLKAGEEERIDPLPEGIPETPWWRDGPVPSCVNHYPNGDRNINMLPTMEGADYLDLGEGAAWEECRRRVYCHWHFLQSRFPEFRRYRLSWIAPMMGVRETYRTVCEKMLTENDILAGWSGQRDDDIIAIADHALDRHGESGGCPELREPYGIPYRCLVPKGLANLLVACRGAGFSSIAASSCRLSRTMLQLGQAAGTAAALARETGCPLPEVPADRLRAELRRQHVQLEFPLTDELRRYLAEA